MSDLLLSKDCSFYPSMYHTRHREKVNLLAWLKGDFNTFLYAFPMGEKWEKASGEHRAAMERHFVGKPVIECLDRYRADVAKRGKTPFNSLVKSYLPAITPSAVLSYRNGASVSNHTGLLAGDIDLKDNPFNAVSLKAFLAKIANVAYAGLSASAQGVWFIVPINQPEQHRAHFAALKAQLKVHNINLDPMPASVVSLRYFSFDEAGHFNLAALPYTLTETANNCPKPPAYAPPTTLAATDNAGKVKAILEQIENTRTDITSGYDAWFSIGCALANEFGENGRDLFHAVSQYHPTYCNGDTDRQFSKCLRMRSNRYTVATFFEIAKRHSIEYKNNLHRPRQALANVAPELAPTAHVTSVQFAAMPRLEPLPENTTHSASNPPASHLSPGHHRERYTDRHTGQPFELLLNEHGYPTDWG